MIRFKVLAVGGVMWVMSAVGQDLFDSAHSHTFADYLWDRGRYADAALEYERLGWLTSDSMAILRAADAYQMAGQYDRAVKRLLRTWPTPKGRPPQVQRRLFRLYVLKGDYDSAAVVLEQMPQAEPAWKVGMVILQGRYADVPPLMDHCPTEACTRLRIYYTEWEHTRRRSPWVAGMLSAVVPGLGKVYLGRHLDAAMAFLLVGGNAWQAWRGFRRDGVESVQGWVFGGLAVGFYLGNVWGAVRAAHRFNHQIDEKLRRRSRRVLVGHP